MPLPINVIELARTGVHIDISRDTPLPINILDIVSTVADSGGHLTIDVSARLPINFLELARRGKSHLTFKF